MIPLIPTLALATVSFVSSASVILRIVIPILPPHPLSRRVAPAEFGLPNFRSLSCSDKSHIWLASLDLLAVAIFIWQTVNEVFGGPTGFSNADDSASSVRVWFLMTIRQTCLLIITAVTLMNVRMGRPASFGRRQWMLWAPTLLLAVTSTVLAGVISGAGIKSLFPALVGYSSTIAVLNTVAFGCLIGTLIAIKRNLAALNDDTEPWPPVRMIQEEPRPSLATEEIDVIRDGASWITSNASSRRNSISAWSFSTHHTTMASPQHGHGSGCPQTGLHPSIPIKSSFWFSSPAHDDNVSPVPPLPSPYPLSPTSETLNDPDPFRRDVPTPVPSHPRECLGSQNSWLTSTSGSHPTLTAWSYPTHPEGSLRITCSHDLHAALNRPATPALANAQVLGGYGYAPGSLEAEKGLAALAAPSGTQIDISTSRLFTWLMTIWVPLGLSLPYLILSSQNASVPAIASVLLILSVTLSSPLLVLNVLFNPLPIPSGLFDDRHDCASNLNRGTTHGLSDPPCTWSHEYKRSTSPSVTVIESRRSGDVWLSNGDAVDGKSKMGRAMQMLSPMPKLSVLPPEVEDGTFTPLPTQTEDSSLAVTVHNTPSSDMISAQFGRLRDSNASSARIYGGDESLAYASRIMIAQKHYSSLAQTMVIPGPLVENRTPVDAVGTTTGAAPILAARNLTHLRTRSVSFPRVPNTTTPTTSSSILPPSFSLPPTPPSVRAARLASLAHKKSFSSGFSFGRVDDMNEIHALTAGVLPLLVPGLNVDRMRIKDGRWSPPGTFSKSKGKRLAKKLNEFGEDFSSPEVHSTPARKRPREPRERKTSGHKRNHFSLPSLGLRKDGVHSLAIWGAEIRGEVEHKVGQYISVPSNVEIGRRNTVFGAESIPNTIPNLRTVQEKDGSLVPKGQATGLGRSMSTRSFGLRVEVPHCAIIYDVHHGSSYSAASAVTLFEDFEAGLFSGPQAESTPHHTLFKSLTQAAPPPLPQENGRSNVVYIKSDNHDSPTSPSDDPPTSEPTPPSAVSSLARWSSRAVTYTQDQQAPVQNFQPKSKHKTRFPQWRGLRPLSLLQDHNMNLDIAGPIVGVTRHLTLGKKQKSKTAAPVQDENTSPGSTSTSKNKKIESADACEVRYQQNGRHHAKSGSSAGRVRPPSMTDHTGFAYSFRD